MADLAARPIDATLSVTKAAHVLGVHPNPVRAWSDQGRLRYYRINPRGDRSSRTTHLERFMAAAGGAPLSPPRPDPSRTPDRTRLDGGPDAGGGVAGPGAHPARTG